MLMVATALGALAGLAVVVVIRLRRRRDDLSPSVRDFAAFRSTLAETESGRAPRGR